MPCASKVEVRSPQEYAGRVPAVIHRVPYVLRDFLRTVMPDPEPVRHAGLHKAAFWLSVERESFQCCILEV